MGSLVGIRPGRRIWIKEGKSNPHGRFHDSKALAILVHGSCARLEQYAAQVPALQTAGISTVAFDYLGCGRSEKPNDFKAYAAQEIYQDLVAVFQKFSKGFDRVILVGHSYGTLLVNRLASEQHASIAAVVLIGAGYPDSKTARMRWIFRLPLFVLRWLQPWLTDHFIRLAFHPNTFMTNPALVELERRRSNANPPYMFAAFHLQALSLLKDEAEFQGWLRAIRVPVLVSAGDKDCLTPLDPSGRKVASFISDADIVEVPLAGHQVHEEQPDALNEKIISFLRDKLA